MENSIIETVERDGGIPVRVNIKYPLSGNGKIDAYIAKTADTLYGFAYKKLSVRDNENGDIKNAEASSLVMSYKVTIDNENFFSFYFDIFVYENGVKSGVKRIPLNFDRRVSDIFFPLKKCRRRELMSALELSLSKIGVSGIYYADFKKRAKKYFKKSNAVLTPKGIYATFDSGILQSHERGATNVFLINS